MEGGKLQPNSLGGKVRAHGLRDDVILSDNFTVAIVTIVDLQ